MAGSGFGDILRVTYFGESHGPAIGCVIDGCPPGMALAESDIQPDLDRRRPGTSRHVTQRREADRVQILSGVFEGLTTGTPIALLIANTDQRSGDYANLLDTFRPGHADYTYWRKYGHRDPRGGGRSSARLTAPTVAAGAVARKWLRQAYGTTVRAWLGALGEVDGVGDEREQVGGDRCPHQQQGDAVEGERVGSGHGRVVLFVVAVRGCPRAGWRGRSVHIGQPAFASSQASESTAVPSR